MIQTEIKENYDKIKAKIKKLEAEIKVERAKIGVLQSQCEHPNMFTYHIHVESGKKCPDCGYMT